MSEQTTTEHLKELVGDLRHEIQKQSSRNHVLTQNFNTQVDYIKKLEKEIKGKPLAETIMELIDKNENQRLAINEAHKENHRLQNLLKKQLGG